jgi:hypothetical protein
VFEKTVWWSHMPLYQNASRQLLAFESQSPSGHRMHTYVSALASLPSSYVRPACIQVTKQSVQGT